MFRRPEDPVRELIVVPSTLTERIIRFFHKGPGGAYQASKATSAKILRSFWWIDLKRDVRLYVACCSVFDKFIRLGQTAQAGFRPMEVEGRVDCIAMNIVGSQGLTSRNPSRI